MRLSQIAIVLQNANWCLSTVLGPLHLSRILYKSALFMQNKPNFQKSQMNVSIFIQMAYENKSNWTLGENKPKTNPIKPNFSLAQIPQLPSPAPSSSQRHSEIMPVIFAGPTEFLLFTLFDIPNMIYAIRKNTLPTGSIARVLPKKRNVFRRILEKKMEV